LDILRRLWEAIARPASHEPIAGLDPQQTRLIVGLGNPGPEYAETRHNVGFRCVDELARRHRAVWQDRTQSLSSLVALIHPAPELHVVLAQPHTFMNRSGSAVSALLGFLGLPSAQALVVYDDMDLPFGSLRLRERGSPGTHNGMRSVVSALSTEAIPRLRVGISQAAPGDATSHVLSEFTSDDAPLVDELVSRAADAALSWAVEGASTAMNRYNAKGV
jgi:peptidyl-tRNA hydrolase, PTH1 family